MTVPHTLCSCWTAHITPPKNWQWSLGTTSCSPLTPAWSHHYDTSIIHLAQNVFYKDPSQRTISLNAPTLSSSRTPGTCPRCPTWTCMCTLVAIGSWQLSTRMPQPRVPLATWSYSSHGRCPQQHGVEKTPPVLLRNGTWVIPCNICRHTNTICMLVNVQPILVRQLIAGADKELIPIFLKCAANILNDNMILQPHQKWQLASTWTP